MSVYSFSQIQTYLQCPLKYKFRYIDKIVPEFEENLHLILWTEIHSALEWLYNEINNFKIPTYNELEKKFVFNFSKKAEEINDENKEDFLTRWKNYLKNFYKKHYPFKDIKVIWTEIQLYIDLWNWVKFQWFIDRLDKKWEDFVLTDYKTNKNLPPEDKTMYEEQLTLYALWVKQKYWKYFKKVFWNLEYLHFDLQDFWEINKDNIERVKAKYQNITKEIENKKVEYNLWSEDAFVLKENYNCKFCDYKEICPLFKHFYSDVENFELPDSVIRQLVDKYVELNNKKKEIDNELKQIKTTLEKVVKKTKLKKLVWKKHTISISKLIYYKILDKHNLKKYLDNKWFLEEVLDIDKTKLKKLIEDKKLLIGDWLIEINESFVLRWK